ncbi:MAG: hypothetical protein ACKVH0_09325, partial [Alphaproteobacteria bacterium]
MAELLENAGSAVWRGVDAAQRDDWVLQLSEGQLDELERAARGTLNVDIASLGLDDLPLPLLDPIFNQMRDD